MLTVKQQKTLDFIVAFQAESGGVSPSIAQIAKFFGHTSKGAIHRHLCGIEERGAIRRLKNRHRAIEVLPQKKTREAWFRFDNEIKELVPFKRPF